MIDASILQQHKVVDWSYTEELSAKTFSQFIQWVNEGKHGELKYLADHRKDLRQKLDLIYLEAQSALVFLFDYFPEREELRKFYASSKSNGLKISSYVFGFNGIDYHHEIAHSLNEIAQELKKKYPKLEWKLALDIHPVLDRDLAARSGLGWFGKNSMLIHQKHGSFLMIGSLILNQKLDLNSKKEDNDHCGNCTACIDACPTDAIDPNTRTLIANQCLSTWTIEMMKDIAPTPKGAEKGSGEIFGCDICQDVCPWNKKREGSTQTNLNDPHQLTDFFLMRDAQIILDELNQMSNNDFKKRFGQTPLERTGKKALIRSISFWKNLKNS
ncbi:MAG: tRNA epoxyqueuosine(34) reductase QueG [Bdellovibrio sp.]